MAQRFVTIKNLDPDEPFIGKYDGEYIIVPAGGQKIVEEDVMFVWMGNPALENTRRYAERTEVFEKLCLKYHAFDLQAGPQPDLLPTLEAYTEDGERIITVLDDPEGDLLTPGDDADVDIQKLQKQMARLERQLAEATMVDTPEAAQGPITRSRPEGEIAEQIADERAEEMGEETSPVPAGDLDDFDIPDDAPTKIPVGGPSSGGTPAATPPRKKSPAKKAPSGRSRGTAGTAGRRGASAAK